MILATLIFFLSLVGIVALFGVKYLEGHKQLEFVPLLRQKADERAHQIKALLAEGKIEAAKLPPKLLHLARTAVHIAALETAHLARVLEEQAHRLADFVSHKHHFEKGETKSEFLKQVSEHAINNHNGSNDSGNSQNPSVGL